MTTQHAALKTPSRAMSARRKAAVRGLTAAQRLALYRLMLLSRRLDDLEVSLKRQNLTYFQVSCAGHEATLAAASLHLRAGHDWFFPYYRDRTLCLGLGVSATDMLLQAVGDAECPASGGRQMPSHWSDPGRHIVSEGSPTGTQFLTAVGCAEAGIFAGQAPAGSEPGIRFASDEVVYCSAGEGATSEGWFFEAMGTACLQRLPVLFHIEDNGYAISTPVAQQTPGGSISRLLKNYPDLLLLEFDGCSPSASDAAWATGTAYARARRGPVLMHAHVVRPYSHSLSDDERHYRPAAELLEQARRDPITTFQAELRAAPDIMAAALDRVEAEVQAELERAEARARQAVPAAPDSTHRHVTSAAVDPTSSAFAQPAVPEGEPMTMVDLVNACLADEMARDPRLVIFGQDVADAASDAALTEVRGKGGVFRVTHGLQRRFGSRRVFNAPLSEANIVGRAIGMALRGLKPVIEIQFFDYIWPAMMHIRNEAALMRWRSNGGWSCPLVIRCTYGGYLKGGAVYHSQTGESSFTHIPGLRVILPATAEDANGLLRTAIRCEDPVLFLEHKHLYRQPYNRAPYPGPDFSIPFGCARLVRSGSQMTLITYGALVKRSADAAAQAAQRGIDVEILDLRSLSPYDWPAIAASVRKTGKALMVHEESRSWGFGAEIAARIGDELFDCLDGPVRRLGSQDTFVPYHPSLEDATLPQIADVLAAIVALAAY